MKLFSKQTLERTDPKEVLRSVLAVPEQAEHAWREARKIRLPAKYRKAQHIAVCGMGGSLLGTHMLSEMYADRLRVPVTLVNGYKLPACVNSKTLVLLSSYSGTTEETLACATEAKKRGALIVGISLGGKLLRQLQKDHKPFYQIIETFNPSNQPRVGVGYSVFGQLGLLRSFFKVTPQEVNDAIAHAKYIRKSWTETQTGISRTRKTIRQFTGKQPVIIAAEFLSGNAHVMSNQWNESGKLFSRYHLLPELNHHLLEGLDNPQSVVKKSLFYFIDSPLYHPRVAKRLRLTKQIVEKQGAKTEILHVQGRTKLDAAIEVLFLSGVFTTAYAISQGIDPSEIVWVDYFKKRLAS